MPTWGCVWLPVHIDSGHGSCYSIAWHPYQLSQISMPRPCLRLVRGLSMLSAPVPSTSISSLSSSVVVHALSGAPPPAASTSTSASASTAALPPDSGAGLVLCGGGRGAGVLEARERARVRVAPPSVYLECDGASMVVGGSVYVLAESASMLAPEPVSTC